MVLFIVNIMVHYVRVVQKNTNLLRGIFRDHMQKIGYTNIRYMRFLENSKALRKKILIAEKFIAIRPKILWSGFCKHLYFDSVKGF